jgi:hypothetical protein
MKTKRARWLCARYRAEIHVIMQRNRQWEIIGPPEVRTPHPGSFNPFRNMRRHSLTRRRLLPGAALRSPFVARDRPWRPSA